MSTIDQKGLNNYQTVQYPQYLQSHGEQNAAISPAAIQPQIPDVQLPDLYYMPNNNQGPKNFKEAVKQADPMGFISPMVEHPLLALLVTGGVFKGFDVLGEHFGGEYNKSLVGKAANFGDKIQKKIPERILSPLRASRDKARIFLHSNSITSAILDTPARPDWDMPRSELHSQQVRTLQEFKDFAGKLGLGSDGKMNRQNIRLDKSETEAAKQFFNVKNVSKIKDTDIVNFIRLKRLKLEDSIIRNIVEHPDSSKLVEEQILKAMELDKATFERIMKDKTGKTIPILEQALEKVNGRLKISTGNIKGLGTFQPFGRYITSNQFYNRLHSISSAKTASGRACAKAMQIFHRMATFGGGKLGLLFFMVPHLINTVSNVQKADNDSKVGTLMNGLLMAGSWVVTIPLAVKIVFGLGGLQNIGVSKENVSKIRELTDGFNTGVINESRNAVKKQIKELKKTGPQNLLVKILRKIGSFIDIGNCNLKGRNLFQKLSNLGKNTVGVPLRFIGALMLSSTVLDGTLAKCCKVIFGNYYDEIKEEEYETNKKNQEEFLRKDLQERLLKAQAAKLETQKAGNNGQVLEPQNHGKEAPRKQITENTPIQTPAPHKNAENVTKIDNYNYIPEQISTIPANKSDNDNYGYIPSQDSLLSNKAEYDNYTYIPSQDSVLGIKNNSMNKYIPAQTPANIKKTFDNSGLAAALKRADKAESNAIKILTGKFPSS